MMGVCMSKPDPEYDITKEDLDRHKEIEKQLEVDRRTLARDKGHKLLLLGPSEAGKSTILKQLRIIYAKGMSPEERNSYRIVIMTNVITAMVTILTHMESVGFVLENEESKAASHHLLQTYKPFLESYSQNHQTDPSLLAAITKLWGDPAVKRASEFGSGYHLIDSAEYFLDRAGEIMGGSVWVPCEQDILRSRVMTTAVTESIVSINRITYRIYDVAGHRGMRHAWANYFEDARAVIFVVAISSYDQCLAEDPTVNRMKDAMQLFAAVCNHPLFAETSVILLLNKIDIFRRKIKVKAIDEVFKDYKGGSDYTQATSYFARIFVKLNKHPDKQIYTHLTWATDTKQTKVVLAAVTDTVQRIALRMAGVL